MKKSSVKSNGVLLSLHGVSLDDVISQMSGTSKIVGSKASSTQAEFDT